MTQSTPPLLAPLLLALAQAAWCEPATDPAVPGASPHINRPFARDQVVREVTTAGFRLVDQPDLLRESYFLRFQKVDGSAH